MLARQLSHLTASTRSHDISSVPVRRTRALAAQATAQPAKRLPLSPPEPGTVKTYEHHVFIQTALPSASWPPAVETQPALLQAFAAVAKAGQRTTGGVKVTAYEEPGEDLQQALGATMCDLMLFPAAVEYRNLPISSIGEVVEHHVALPEDQAAEEEPPAPLNPKLAALGQAIQGMRLFVCCHASRDTRCGNIGPPLVRRLRTLTREAELQQDVQVYSCSHVGGHKFAGNVLVFGPVSPCDGDWFGGISADNAEQVFEALTTMQIGTEGGPTHPVLRRPMQTVRPFATRQTANKRGFRVVPQATNTDKELDFDAILESIADKFENSENKTAIVGYGAAALGAFVFAEWLIHLPGLNILLGFPIQLLGLLTAPVLVVKYVLDGEDFTKDAQAISDKVVKKLPGLK
ncbi:hypothetical protein WJX72_011092 [[Myrmecia] bisecta]|uniref:Uncharacterized protein n=1 Tax=[Myrmecia] bisecta TaxID=41462 RepID=A0AAW1QTB8_9CHLO